MPFRFTGMEQDRETGLIYYGARYLDPRMSGWGGDVIIGIDDQSVSYSGSIGLGSGPTIVEGHVMVLRPESMVFILEILYKAEIRVLPQKANRRGR